VKKLEIRTSGQTAADRAVLEWAFGTGIECAGWCPKGRSSVNGIAPEKFHLKETPSSNPLQSSEWNVWDADGVAIVSATNEFPDFLQKTIEFAHKHRKPLLHVPVEPKLATIQLRRFVENHQIGSLNIVCHKTAEAELEHLLPLILTDAFSSSVSPSPPDVSRRNNGFLSVETNVLRTYDFHPPSKIGAEADIIDSNELFVSLCRAWEGKTEYIAKVQEIAPFIDPGKMDDSDTFYMMASLASLFQFNFSEATRYLEQISKGMREHPHVFFVSGPVYLAAGNWQMLLETAQKHAHWLPGKSEGWIL
jgi:hypothetical protein